MFKLVVLSCLIALAAARPSVISPLWGAHLGSPLVAPWGAAIASRIVAPVAVAPIAAAPLAIAAGPLAIAAGHIGAPNYRGPLSLAPGQPANILAADGRPLDTLDVNVDRINHLTAKVVNGHLLKKRSIVGAPILAGPVGPVVWPHAASLHIPAAHVVAPISVAPWGLGHW